jgi:hypothetical protein
MREQKDMTTLTNQELLGLNKLLGTLKDAKNLKVAWMVAQNVNRLAPHLKIIQDMLAPTDAMKKLEAERQKMALNYVVKDPMGNPIQREDPRQQGTTLYEIEDSVGYKTAFDALVAEHPQAKEDSDAIQKKETELLQESVEVDVYTLSVENTKISSDPDNSVLDASAMITLLRCGILKE